MIDGGDNSSATQDGSNIMIRRMEDRLMVGKSESNAGKQMMPKPKRKFSHLQGAHNIRRNRYEFWSAVLTPSTS